MRIVYDYPPYKRALKAMWPKFEGRCVCAVDERGILGGCGVTKVVDGRTSAFILGIRHGWASRSLYAAIMRLPVEMGAEEVVANCGRNTRSQAVCRQMGLSEVGAGVFKATSEGLLKRAKEIEDAS